MTSLTCISFKDYCKHSPYNYSEKAEWTSPLGRHDRLTRTSRAIAISKGRTSLNLPNFFLN